jgi:hypothetical protein
VEQVGRRVRRLFGPEQLEGLQGFLVNPPVGQGLGVGQGQVRPEEFGLFGVLEQGRDRDRGRGQRVAGLPQQPGRVGAAQREGVSQPVEGRATLLTPERRELSGFRGVALGDFL